MGERPVSNSWELTQKDRSTRSANAQSKRLKHARQPMDNATTEFQLRPPQTRIESVQYPRHALSGQLVKYYCL